MAARALIHLSDLRRWARVSREEGVAIHGRIEAGGVTITVNPASPLPARDEDDDFDDKMRRFLGK